MFIDSDDGSSKIEDVPENDKIVYRSGFSFCVKWIPVKDSLPDFGVPVLICCDYNGRTEILAASRLSIHVGSLYDYQWDEMASGGYDAGCYNPDEVSHWMAFPAPPERGNIDI